MPTQGLNYVAGLLLLVTKDEEQSFWLLTVLIRNILPSYYSSNMHGLVTDIAVLGDLVRAKCPQIDRTMENLRLPWPIIVTKWFVCLFAEVLPIEVYTPLMHWIIERFNEIIWFLMHLQTVLRVWDCLFNEGSKVLFRVAITLVKLHEDELCKCTDFGEMAETYKKIARSSFVLDCHVFMAVLIYNF